VLIYSWHPFTGMSWYSCPAYDCRSGLYIITAAHLVPSIVSRHTPAGGHEAWKLMQQPRTWCPTQVGPCNTHSTDWLIVG
jgi:hypothetical protein